MICCIPERYLKQLVFCQQAGNTKKSPTVHIMYTVGHFLSYNDLICSDNFIRCSAPALTLYTRVYCLIWALCAVRLISPSLPASHGTIPDAQR